jgi:alanyl-tRNA synthetase
MTSRLYYDSPLLAFDAVAIAHDGGDPSRVVLDRTAFYPTSGGQPHDTGLLGGARVTDVIDDEDGDRIIHVCDAPVPLGAVHGQVDAARRHDFTQQHTAQHLVSALAADRLGWATESVHFGADHSTIEFGTDGAPEAALRVLEEWSNAAVGEALPVTVGYEDAESATGLRKPPAREGIIRVITIAGVDRSACGGTHVATTAAIGPVLIRGAEKIRGRVRVGFLAGDRALRRAAAHDAVLLEIARALSCPATELLDVVPKRVAALKAATDEVTMLRLEVVKNRVASLAADAQPGPDGTRRVTYTFPPEEAEMLSLAVKAASRVPGLLFIGLVDGGTAVAVGAHPDTGVDAGARLKAALASVGGRGGGMSRVAQGTMAEPGQVAAVVAALLG